MSVFTTSDHVEIYYKDWGKGRPVLLSHGWPLSADMWDEQMIALAEAGYRVIAFDRRGFGRSSQPWGGYTYDRFADDIAELIAHLDLSDITLVGFSMGGGDISRYVARHGTTRVRSLALLGAVTPVFMQRADHPFGPDKAFFDGLRAALLADRAQVLVDFAPVFFGRNHGQAVSDGALAQFLQLGLMGSVRAEIESATAFAETDFRPDMAAITVPALVIHGDDDQVVPFEGTGRLAAEMLPDAQLRIYPGAPHGFTVTHQAQLTADLLDFLRL